MNDWNHKNPQKDTDTDEREGKHCFRNKNKKKLKKFFRMKEKMFVCGFVRIFFVIYLKHLHFLDFILEIIKLARIILMQSIESLEVCRLK